MVRGGPGPSLSEDQLRRFRAPPGGLWGARRRCESSNPGEKVFIGPSTPELHTRRRGRSSDAPTPYPPSRDRPRCRSGPREPSPTAGSRDRYGRRFRRVQWLGFALVSERSSYGIPGEFDSVDPFRLDSSPGELGSEWEQLVPRVRWGALELVDLGEVRPQLLLRPR